jgi:DNA-binding NtrC family response regulator
MSARRKTDGRKPTPGAGGPRSAGRLQRAIDAVVRQEIRAALRETGGNVVQAARGLGISQPGLYKRLTALGIDPAKYRR